MKRPFLTVTVVIVAAAIALLGLPYYDYSNLETTYSQVDEDESFPYDLGFRMTVAYEASYDGSDGDLDLTVTTEEFNTWENWQPDPKPEYTSYVLYWWGVDTASVVPDEALFCVHLSVVFESESGTIYQPIRFDGEFHPDVYDAYDEAGTYDASYTVDRRNYDGTYTIRATLLVQDGEGTWNVTKAWAVEVLVIDNHA